MRVVVRVYTNGTQKPHFDEFKDDSFSELELEDVKENIGVFLDEAQQVWQEIADGEDNEDDSTD